MALVPRYSLRTVCTILGLCMFSLQSFAITIAVGSVSGAPLEQALLPITLDGPQVCSSVLLRMEYDPLVLVSPSVSQGGLLTGAHVLDSFTPEPGRLNLTVYAMANPVPFLSDAGVIANLHFTVRENAPAGPSEIRLTANGVPDLPASQLLDSAGVEIEHSVTPGEVLVEVGSRVGNWMLY